MPTRAIRMCLRGRDLAGRSYEIPFSDSDFQRHGGTLVIGRSHDFSQLILSHDSVSRQHATLSFVNGQFQVGDRNSGNGTQLNGRVLSAGSQPTPLRHGDKLTLGEVDLMFEVIS
jgi:pSer/pThr/pTyr-binding forkhead associated (FHA) protein